MIKQTKQQTQSDMMQNTDKSKEIKSIYSQIGKLIEQSEEFGAEQIVVSDLEQNILKGLLGAGLSLLRLGISSRAEAVDNEGLPKVKSEISSKGIASRKYQSLFGEIEISRSKYQIAGKGSYYPLDDRLNLPQTKISYVLQNWVVGSSADLDFRESVRSVNDILGLSLNATQSKAEANRLGQQVDDFYEQTALPTALQGQYICLEWDGKGVPIIKQEREDSPEALAATSVVGRLKRGQKTGVKKMATVSVMSTFTPNPREKESIIRGLFKTPLTPMEDKANPLQIVHKQGKWHQNIHRRAFLGKQEHAIEYGIQRAQKLNGEQKLPFVVLLDGGVGLEPAVKAAFDKEGLSEDLKYIILDIVHVSEYVWKAGNAILGEKSKFRTGWVKGILSDILDGKISQVIEELKQNRDKTPLSESAQKLLGKTITYFTNHQHKMDYKTYLEQGLPVSTALVESSCGHLVKDRMERSGMRWSLAGAQNMMEIRAVKKNGDWSKFMDFILDQNQQHYKQKRA